MWATTTNSTEFRRVQTLASPNQTFPLVHFEQQCNSAWCTWQGALPCRAVVLPCACRVLVVGAGVANPSFAACRPCSTTSAIGPGANATGIALQATYACDPTDLHASAWAPSAVFDPSTGSQGAWVVLYVGYTCDGTQLVTAGAGNIFGLQSTTPGQVSPARFSSDCFSAEGTPLFAVNGFSLTRYSCTLPSPRGMVLSRRGGIAGPYRPLGIVLGAC